MREFLLMNAGAIGALLLMTVATFVPHRAVRVILSIMAGLILVAHAVLLLALIGIGSSGSEGESAIADLRNRVVVSGILTFLWAAVLLSRPNQKPIPPAPLPPGREGSP